MRSHKQVVMHIIWTCCIYILTSTFFNCAALFDSWYKQSMLKYEGLMVGLLCTDFDRLMTFL